MKASEFATALNPLYHLSQYKPTVELTMYDSNKIKTNDSTKVVYYEYLVKIVKWRDTSLYNLPYIDNNFTSIVSITKLQSHSASISGTFKLFINGKPLLLPKGGTYSLADIPYSIDGATLTASFNNFYKSNEIIVKHVMDTNALDSF